MRRGAHFACILLKKERPKHSRLLFLCKRSNLWSIFQKIKNDNKNNTAIGTILIMVVVIQNDARFSSNMHGFFKSPPLVYLTNFKGNSVDRWIGCYHCCVECHSRAFEISHTKTAEAIINPSSFHPQNPQMLDQFNFRPLVLPYMTCGSSSDFLLIKGNWQCIGYILITSKIVDLSI